MGLNVKVKQKRFQKKTQHAVFRTLEYAAMS